MNKELIIWNDATTNTQSNSVEMGVAYEVFAGNQMFVVKNDKNDKKAVIMFKDKATGKVATVIMQNQVSDDFKAGKFTATQALGLPIVLMKKLERVLERDASGKATKTELITDKPTMWLGKPGLGWVDFAGATEVTNYEDLVV